MLSEFSELLEEDCLGKRKRDLSSLRFQDILHKTNARDEMKFCVNERLHDEQLGIPYIEDRINCAE